MKLEGGTIGFSGGRCLGEVEKSVFGRTISIESSEKLARGGRGRR